MSTKTAHVATASTTLPLNTLRIDDKSNVRKIGVGADPEFVASIRAVGVKLPLIVRPNGKGHVVVDGGKRLAALQALAKAGDIAEDAAVPVIIENVTDASARETSLALNVIRSQMHPVDEFRAYAALNTDKSKPLDVEAIATRFGVETKIVAQRLALGELHDVILTAWQNGSINADSAKAFTLLQDKNAQAAMFAKLKKRGALYPHTIKSEIRAGQRNVGTILEVVGEAAYLARGGKVNRDLFGSDHVVSDADLLNTMANEKVTQIADRLKAEGWGWVMTEYPNDRWSYGRLETAFKPTPKEKAELKALEAICEDEDAEEDAAEAASLKHDALTELIKTRNLSAKQKAGAGCIVVLESNGLTIEYGYVEPKTAKAEKKAAGKPSDGKDAPKAPPKLSQALADRLLEQRLTGIKAALVAHPHNSPFASMLAGLIASMIQPGSRYHSAPDKVQKAFDTIANGIAPKVMNAALRKAFNASDYFDGAPKAFALAAIAEAVNADEARKLGGAKRTEIAKFATINVPKTGWLPKELRVAAYDGPQKKTAIKTAKPKAKAPAKQAAKKAATAKTKTKSAAKKTARKAK